MRPNSILLNAYLSEHYKIESGSKRKVSYGKYLGAISSDQWNSTKIYPLNARNVF